MKGGGTPWERQLQRNGQRAPGWGMMFGRLVTMITIIMNRTPNFCRALCLMLFPTLFMTGDLESPF